jgi:hypothetical protein
VPCSQLTNHDGLPGSLGQSQPLFDGGTGSHAAHQFTLGRVSGGHCGPPQLQSRQIAQDNPIEGSLTMRFKRFVAVSGVAAIMYWSLGSNEVSSRQPITLQPNGSIQVATQNLRCGGVRNALDSRLPNLGISVPVARLIVINPTRLARQPETVRLFVFYHECGHHHVGASELSADCWAVRRGQRDGWLNKAGLAQICSSFGNSSGTPTHPSATQRCSNLDRCFAGAASFR